MYIFKVLFAALIALSLFYKSLQLNLVNISIIVACVFGIAISKYTINKNRHFYKGLIVVVFMILVFADFYDRVLSKEHLSISLYECLRLYILQIPLNVYFWIVFVVSCLFLLLFHLDVLSSYSIYNESPRIDLYNERKRDLNRLCEAFNTFNVIGVVGDWGSGKTLLTKYLEHSKKGVKNGNWCFIRINALALKLDRVELLIVTELEQLLENEGIISIHAKSLKNALSNSSLLNAAYMFVFPSELYAEAIEGLKRDIINNELKVALIIEDLDRVNNFEVIDNLLNISNVLQHDSIKFIFEYNFDKMNMLNVKFDREYLDKYIYSEVFVTPIKLFRLISALLKKSKYNFMKEDDFVFINSKIYIFAVNQTLGVSYSFEYKLEDQPVRKVEHLLKSIEHYINNLEKNNVTHYNKRAIIVFFILKFFEQKTWYNFMGNFTNVPDSFKFNEYDEYGHVKNSFTLRELLISDRKDPDEKGKKTTNFQSANKERAISIITDSRNRVVFRIISWLNYNVLSGSDGRSRTLADEHELRDIAYNEDVDAMLRNLMWEGKSREADILLAIDNLYKTVFLKGDTSEWLDSYETYLQENYLSNFQNEQCSERTPFLMGVDPIVTLFQCMSMYLGKKRDWKFLLELLFKIIGYRNNNQEMLDWKDIMKCLSIVDYKDIDTVRFLMNKYNQLSFKCNLKEDESFWVFLQKIIPWFAIHGEEPFFHMKREQLSFYEPGLQSKHINYIIKDILEPMKEHLEKSINVKSELSSNEEYKDNHLFYDFVKKNIEMLKI